MIERTINISGKDVVFRSSATVPRLYRAKFKRDIFKDLSKLEKSYSKRKKGEEELQIDDLEIFENVAYIMAFHADPSIPKTIDEWLDQFEMFSIYQVLPQILELWGDNLMTDVQAKTGTKLHIPERIRRCSFCDAVRSGSRYGISTLLRSGLCSISGRRSPMTA